VIGKITRGTSAARLLRYLYGPGKANEHTDPHLVAGFGDPAELEPERGPSAAHDLRRLAALLNQPLAALNGANYAKPVWHCSVRAAPQDRMLSDAEWARIAARIMHRTGLAPDGDDLAVRWVAVRHAPDHIHLVATLARQDRIRPKLWNDFYRVREACQEAERWYSLRATAPADRTAAKRPTRAESEQAARRGWSEPPRVQLRREVCTAAAGARTEQEFFARLAEAGVQVRYRHSKTDPSQITGYAVSLPHHTGADGQPIWYSGGKLAADLTLPKLRSRWRNSDGPLTGAASLSDPALRAVLRTTVQEVAGQAADEPGFFARLRAAGLLVRLRHSDLNPGQVTGYSVALPNCTTPDGTPRWVSGGRLSDALTVPRLRRIWSRPDRPGEHHGSPRFTHQERSGIYEHAARCAAEAAEHLRHCTADAPNEGADAVWAAADTLHAAAKALRNPLLHCVADSYDRAARAPQGRPPERTHAGDSLRTTARLLAMSSRASGDITTQVLALIANLVVLVEAVAELRAAQAHFVQADAAREAAGQLHATLADAGQRPSAHAWAPRNPAQADFPHPLADVLKAAPSASSTPHSRPRPPRPPTHARPPTR
jgi:hypothetical protein